MSSGGTHTETGIENITHSTMTEMAAIVGSDLEVSARFVVDNLWYDSSGGNSYAESDVTDAIRLKLALYRKDAAAGDDAWELCATEAGVAGDGIDNSGQGLSIR